MGGVQHDQGSDADIVIVDHKKKPRAVGGECGRSHGIVLKDTINTAEGVACLVYHIQYHVAIEIRQPEQKFAVSAPHEEGILVTESVPAVKVVDFKACYLYRACRFGRNKEDRQV